MIRKLYVAVFFLVLLGAFLRLFRFETFLEFLDDQGRDAIVMKRILVDHDLTLLGPGTSVGKMYLGPLYYYAMTPFLAMTYPDPTGPAYMVAVLGIVTMVLLFWWGKTLVGEKAALIATAMYATAPTVISLARFSWQPNPAPLVSLCMMWWTYSALEKKKPWYWVLVALGFAVLTHIHYVALLAALPSGILLGYDVWRTRKQKKWGIRWISIFSASLAIFIVSVLPLAAFDLRHDHLILNGFQDFFVGQQRHVSLLERFARIALDAHGRSMFMSVELFGFPLETRWLNTIVTLLFIAGSIWLIKTKATLGNKIILIWCGLTLLGLSVYRDNLHPHYIGFIFPAAFLLGGAVLAHAARKSLGIQIGISVAIISLCVWNISRLPYFRSNHTGYLNIRSISKELAASVDSSKKYNIALLNNNREYRGMKYRYFFETTDHPPQSQYDYTNLDELIVLVENGEDPKKSPIYEIQQFFRENPRAKLLTSREYRGIVKVYLFGK